MILSGLRPTWLIPVSQAWVHSARPRCYISSGNRWKLGLKQAETQEEKAETEVETGSGNEPENKVD